MRESETVPINVMLVFDMLLRKLCKACLWTSIEKIKKCTLLFSKIFGSIADEGS